MSDVKAKIVYFNHDLRNNIGGAVSSLELLSDTIAELKDDFYFNLAVSSLKQAIERTNEIASFCALSNEEAKQACPANLKIFPIREYWDKYSKKDYDRLRRLYDIEINDTYKVLPDEKFAAVDPESMSRVRENIIANAVNAGARRIDILYEMQKHAGCVTFKDNGRGMTKEEIDKIMLFQCGDGIIHGLGTKSIINAIKDNGFHVSFSANETKGTSVRIIFPYIN